MSDASSETVEPQSSNLSILGVPFNSKGMPDQARYFALNEHHQNLFNQMAAACNAGLVPDDISALSEGELRHLSNFVSGLLSEGAVQRLLSQGGIESLVHLVQFDGQSITQVSTPKGIIYDTSNQESSLALKDAKLKVIQNICDALTAVVRGSTTSGGAGTANTVSAAAAGVQGAALSVALPNEDRCGDSENPGDTIQ